MCMQAAFGRLLAAALLIWGCGATRDGNAVDSGTAPGNASTANLLVLLGQRQLSGLDGTDGTNWPDYIAQRKATIETLPFDGIAIHFPSTYDIYSGTSVSQATLASEWASYRASGTWTRARHNFAVVMVSNQALDVFDSDAQWEVLVQNFVNLARLAADLRLEGILFDDEDYADRAFVYSSANPYGKTLAQYQTQAMARGRQVMSAILAANPALEWISLFGVARNFAQTPCRIDPWASGSAGRRFEGAFNVGVLSALADAGRAFVDGAEEAYYYREASEFDDSYAWRKSTMGSSAANCPYVPAALRDAAWSSHISISFGIYDLMINSASCSGVTIPLDFAPGHPPLPPSTLERILACALERSDKYVWLFWEDGGIGSNWYVPGGVASPYVDAVTNAWSSTR